MRMFIKAQPMREKTRPNTRRKMRLADLRTDGQTDGRTDKRTNGRTDTPSYKDATAHLKSVIINPFDMLILICRDVEAVDFSATSASALPLPLPQKCSYFISSYPTH